MLKMTLIFTGALLEKILQFEQLQNQSLLARTSFVKYNRIHRPIQIVLIIRALKIYLRGYD